jgi:hypothetical protein
MSNIITNPYFTLSVQATRGKTARERRAGVQGLIELVQTTNCRWTDASASSDLADIHCIHLMWNNDTESYDVSRKGTKWRRFNADIVPLAEVRALRAERPTAAEAKSGTDTATTNPAA